MDSDAYGRRSYDHWEPRVRVLESQMIDVREEAREMRAAATRMESFINRAIGAMILLNTVGIAAVAWLGGHH